jgi:hypothetical protein
MSDWVLYLTIAAIVAGVFFGVQWQKRRTERQGIENAQSIPAHFMKLGIETKEISKQEAEIIRGKTYDSVMWFVVQDKEIELIEIGFVKRVGTVFAPPKRVPYLGYIFHISKSSTAGMYPTEPRIDSEAPPSVKWRSVLRFGFNNRLAESLDGDENISRRLVQSRDQSGRMDWEIIPEPVNGVAVIRTRDKLPTREQFEVIEAIAKHVKFIC